MARPLRVEYEGAVYHVTARGNERRKIFYDDADRQLFLQTVGEAAALHDWRVHAFCLMPNHYHLAVETARANLSQSMAWLQTTYTVRFNRRHGRSGHLFQGRFKAHVVETDGYAPVLVRYIHLNPVAGRSVARGSALPREAWAQLREFAWSSHRAYAGLKPGPPWLCLDWLSFFGERRAQAQEEYRAQMRAWFEEGPVELSELVRGGLVLGGEVLWAKVRERMRRSDGDEAVRWVKRAGGREEIEAARRLAQAEVDPRLQVWLRVEIGGEKRVEVARDFGWSDGSAVTQLLRRLEARRSGDAVLDRKMRTYRKLLASSIKL